MTDLPALTTWLLAQLDADEAQVERWREQRALRPDGDERGDEELAERVRASVETKRGLIEWAQGIEYLRSVEDPRAPQEPLGEDVVRIIAEEYAGRPEWREEWRLSPGDLDPDAGPAVG